MHIFIWANASSDPLGEKKKEFLQNIQISSFRALPDEKNFLGGYIWC